MVSSWSEEVLGAQLPESFLLEERSKKIRGDGQHMPRGKSSHGHELPPPLGGYSLLAWLCPLGHAFTTRVSEVSESESALNSE